MNDSMNIPERETLSYKPNKLTTQTLEKSERGEDLHEVSNAEELIKELHSPEQPKSVKRGFMGLGCNKPASAPREGKEKTTLDIEPETQAENKESVGQPQQPNQQLMIIKTIQGLMTCVNDNLEKLPKHPPGVSNVQYKNYDIIAKALEEIDLFEKTTLFDLQKEYE